jgi:hypothetical protein
MISSEPVFELRTYHAAPGRMAALQDRFRDHTLALFEKHGLGVVGFWTSLDAADEPGDTLVYLLAFDDRQAARSAWAAFRDDPDWARVRAESEPDGPLTVGIESMFLRATDFSPLLSR